MFLEVRGIRKSFGPDLILDGVSFDVEAHETLVILGRSGSGKTTLLKILAGLESKDSGSLVLDGRPIDAVPPQSRNIVYLYQEPLLFPHMSVAENLGFGLRLRRVGEGTLRDRVGEMLAELGLEEHAAKNPEQLSGGQRQRVSFGRALIVNPALLLLDEPFGNLDFETRGNMQSLFKSVARRHRITSLFVTHDIKEAVLMGDRIAHIRSGRVRTFGGIEDLAEDPELGLDREMDFWMDLGRKLKNRPAGESQ